MKGINHRYNVWHCCVAALYLTLAGSPAWSEGLNNLEIKEKIELHEIVVNISAVEDRGMNLDGVDDQGMVEQNIDDPWEGFNRRMYSFNIKADRYVIKPVAEAYDAITPKPVQRSIGNFFSNLKSLTTLTNELLQGRPVDSTKTLGRLAVNTTVGILGFFDPATYIGLERRNEDFGQTLAVWGWQSSNYVVLPLLGPLTTRDVFGFIGDTPTNPMNYADGGANAALQSLEITDMRTQMMPMDELRADAIDEYAMVRHAWAEGRKKEIIEGTELQTNVGTTLLQRVFQ